MKWLSKKTETAILLPTFGIGISVAFAFQGNPIMAVGFVSAITAEARLCELYMFDSLISEKMKNYWRKRHVSK